MKKIQLGKKEVIHFIGIGGIGMSGLAQIMKTLGFSIQGSDIGNNKNINNCKKLGIRVFIGHKKSNIAKATIIVKSSAIKANNVEMLAAKNKKIPIYDRIEMLANVIDLKKNIIITGSHGKTTTTSLVAKITSSARLDPTIINGGVINSLKSNAKFGKGDLAVVEADESDGSFLKVPINYSIVTNIDLEHLDFYKNFNNLKNAFIKFIEKTPPIGKTFLCIDDLNIKSILK
ncbi:MAG: Mur ligase domain-containing protein, partial [Pelagibacteraceae bacterium]